MWLRKWQAACVALAFKKFTEGQKHFFVLATPGSGKTVMAASLANELFIKNLIDYVVCFAPSLAVLESMRSTFSTILNRPMHGQLGAAGGVFSYQYLASSKSADWSFLKNNRVLVIFDEIHHCSGDDPNDANAWGREILVNIGKHAHFILSMTGTPWRSDLSKISLATYIDPDNTIKCDFSYGLSVAIQDGVCRLPFVTLIDNDQLKVANETYDSLSSAIKQSELRYSEILKSDDAVKYLIDASVKQLAIARTEQKNAAGLVVASSLEEAFRIQHMLSERFRQSSVLVSYKDPNAHQKIREFRTSDLQWIISIGMVAEGTDIPRLRVCAHLSLIRTELFFRQVLGRVLRLIPDIDNQKGWLFSFAEPSLVEYANKLQQDIPDEVLRIEKIKEFNKTDLLKKNDDPQRNMGNTNSPVKALGNWSSPQIKISGTNTDFPKPKQMLSFRLQGQYRQQVFSIF